MWWWRRWVFPATLLQLVCIKIIDLIKDKEIFRKWSNIWMNKCKHLQWWEIISKRWQTLFSKIKHSEILLALHGKQKCAKCAKKYIYPDWRKRGETSLLSRWGWCARTKRSKYFRFYNFLLSQSHQNARGKKIRVN